MKRTEDLLYKTKIKIKSSLPYYTGLFNIAQLLEQKYANGDLAEKYEVLKWCYRQKVTLKITGAVRRNVELFNQNYFE